MQRARLRLAAVLAAAAGGAAALTPVAARLTADPAPPATAAWCYEVTADVLGWHPSFEVCNLPEIGQGPQD